MTPKGGGPVTKLVGKVVARGISSSADKISGFGPSAATDTGIRQQFVGNDSKPTTLSFHEQVKNSAHRLPGGVLGAGQQGPLRGPLKAKDDEVSQTLNRDKIESNLSVPGTQGRHENALIKSSEMSPHLTCLYASTIPTTL